MTDAAVDLSDVQRSLRLFAQAVAGRAIQLEALDEGRIGWPFALTLPDPAVVELSASISAFGTPAGNRGLYRAQVLRHLAFAAFGTFGDDALTDPLTHPSIVASPHRWIAGALLVPLEELRVMAAATRRYPGAVHDLGAARALGRGNALAAPLDGVVGAVRLLALGTPPAVALLHCTDLGPTTAQRVIERCGSLGDASATVDDAIDIALELAEWCVGRPATPATHGDGVELDQPDPEEATGPELDTPDPGGLSTNPPPLDAEADRSSEHLTGTTQATPIAQSADLTPVERSATARGRSRPAPRAALPEDALVFLYDEWDYHGAGYLRSWCRLAERRLGGDDHGFIGDVRRRHAELGNRIRRQFAMLRPEERVRTHRNTDGDEFDLDAVIEAIVDRRSGVFADDRLHIRRERAARDVATAFLVDLSASTSSPVEEPTAPQWQLDDDDDDDSVYPWGHDPPGPKEPERRIIDVAKDAVALMCDALDQLGDLHGVFGFSGTGRDHVDFRVAKDFDDRTSASSWSALAAMEPIGYTRMGPAIRHTTAKLRAQDARTKLLIMISDGHPQDVDYGPDRTDKQYGLHDTARALVEATAAGIDTFCVTIDPAGHDYLRTMSPDERYLVIDEVNALPSELAKLYLTLGAAGRHRSDASGK